ncbi:sugar ABC transporter permease [Thermobifida alba]|uniref:Sugar ABC transporter permease n=1 Tax=Thermobifida alba TaxID=53522 RepID=A0ABY4KWI3_THEAE|nr:sugar ABC transporter permease [Thermobifida alba]UPT19796.1 sugar ABC transporter permease [Thermobifida alba]
MTLLRRGGAPPGGTEEPALPPPGNDARAKKERRQIFWTRLDLRVSPYLFISPFFILFAIFGLFPLLYTVWVSLHDWTLLGGNQGFVGIDNYIRLVQDAKFWNSLYNTFGIFIIAVVPQLLLAMYLADTLSRRIRAVNFFRMGLLLPYLTSVAAVAIVFSQLFGTQFGLINYALGFIGIDPINWQGGTFSSWIAIAVMVDWRWTGYNALIYLAAMSAIPRDIYEAASIDGASRTRQFWQITVPMLRPTIIFTVIVSTIGQMQLFTEPVIFGGVSGGSQGQFQTTMMLIFEEAFRFNNYGYGSAIAWTLFMLVVALSALNALLSSRIKGA